ncbi:MAG: magnesium transporter CorA family protein [Chloroflexi bacterium]|jgi:magnesium transporter|nr:magnesium transporter CorA family protein [Chloroflexota bacterium]
MDATEKPSPSRSETPAGRASAGAVSSHAPGGPAPGAAAGIAAHGIGSHGGHSEAGEGAEAVVVHRPGYPARRLEPVPGVGVERSSLPEGVLAKEAADHLRVWALLPSGAAEETRDLVRLRELVADAGTRIWVDLADATHGLVAEVADALRIHPLVAEDIAERGQRPKLEITGDEAHIVVYAIAYGDRLETTEIDMVLARDYLLTSHPAGWDPLETHHLRMGPAPLLARGSDYLAWALIDSLVDSYYPIVDGIDTEIDTLEDEILASADKAALERLLDVKRALVDLRRVVSPTREVFNQLTNRELGLVQAETILYFRDVYDHLVRLNEELDSVREVASGILDVYLTSVNNNLSNIMKRLTGVTVILAGVAAIGGIFGMSEAGAALEGGEHTGFWIVTAIIVLFAGLTAAVLRRIDWI